MLQFLNKQSYHNNLTITNLSLLPLQKFRTFQLKNKSNQFKGVTWALAGAIAMSNVYIFSKAALSEIHLFQFGFYWFGLGLIWNLFYSTKTKKFQQIKGFSKSSFIAIGIIGIMEVVSTSLFFVAIQSAENPAVISFLADTNPLFVAILGVVLLKERFNLIESFGMALIILGALIISYKGDTGLDNLLIPGTQYILLSVSIYAVATIYAKTKISVIPPAILSINRVLLLFVFSTVLLLANGYSVSISWVVFINLLIGSLLGPFLTGLANYSSLQYIEASKSSIIRSSRSLFVVIGAYVYFGTLPHATQLIGGLFTLSGVIVISLGKSFPKSLKKKFRLSS